MGDSCMRPALPDRQADGGRCTCSSCYDCLPYLTGKFILGQFSRAGTELDKHDGQRHVVQASFEHARAPPVHQRDPSLTVAEILPGLPLPVAADNLACPVHIALGRCLSRKGGLLKAMLARAAVLPDMERWKDNYVLMVFDGEPTADHERVARLPADEAKRIAGVPVRPCHCPPSSYWARNTGSHQ